MLSKVADIMVLPPLEKLAEKKLKLFFLPDGNERAKTVDNEGYNGGGKKVVEMIDYLIRRNDIAEATFAILSMDNISNRGDNFFKQIYTAFLGLGVSIINNNSVINNKVRLEVVGNLDFLRVKSPMASDLADMISTVVAQTHLNKDPLLTVKFAFAYPNSYLVDEDVDVVFRSGMESEGSFRSSGLYIPNDTICQGYTDLWPMFDCRKVMSAIDELKSKNYKRFTDGYDWELVEKILGQENMRLKRVVFPTKKKLELNKEEMQARLKSSNLHGNPKISTRIRNGELVVGAEYNSTKRSIVAASGSSFRDTHLSKANNFDAIILPGQSKDFHFPEDIDVGYANLKGCEVNVDSITEAIRDAVYWATSSPSLRGGQRIVVPDALSQTSIDSEKRKYSGLYRSNANPQWISDLKKANFQSMGFKNFNDYYNHFADVFVAGQFKEGNVEKSLVGNEDQFSSFVNLGLIVYFMCYYPHLRPMDKEWKIRAEELAKYMMAAFLLDEAVIDEEREDENLVLKKLRIQKITDICKKYFVENQPLDKLLKTSGMSESDKSTLNIVFTDLMGILDHSKNKGTFKNKWTEDLVGLFQSNVNEREHPTKFDQRSEILAKDEAYMESVSNSDIPRSFKLDFQESRKNYLSTNSLNELVEFQFFLHLLEVRRSIGAGMSFRTLALFVDENKCSKQIKGLLDEAIFLNDLYYRIWNDIGGFARNINDQESARDTVGIMKRRYRLIGHSEQAAVLRAVAYLKAYANDIEVELKQKSRLLAEHLPEIGIPMFRAEIAAVAYKQGHLRTTNRAMMREYMETMLECGKID